MKKVDENFTSRGSVVWTFFARHATLCHAAGDAPRTEPKNIGQLSSLREILRAAESVAV